MKIKITHVNHLGLMKMGWKQYGHIYIYKRPVWKYNGAVVLLIQMVLDSHDMTCSYDVYTADGEVYRSLYCNTCKSLIADKIDHVYKEIFNKMKKIGVIPKKGVPKYA